MTDLTHAARRAWGALETLHVIGYFAEETTAKYVELGLHERLSYFPARAAALGAVGPRVTEATFYVFAPWLHDAALPAAWDTVTPEQMVRARREGMAEALDRVLGTPDVGEALSLSRGLCEELTAPGRPLYAAHAQLDWPADDLLALWHAATLVREHRGDGHVAVLTSRGVDPVEATLLDGVWSGKEQFLRSTRGWSEEEFASGAERLRSRGWFDASGALTAGGRAAREELESQTDHASLAPWAAMGLASTSRLAELLAPLRKTVIQSGVLPKSVGASKAS